MSGSNDIGGNRLTLLARLGELLSSPGAGEQTLERLASLLVTGFAGWCAIDVLRDDGSIERVATAPHEGPPLRADRAHGPAVVLRTGEPELLRRAPDGLVPGIWRHREEVEALLADLAQRGGPGPPSPASGATARRTAQ